MFAPFQISFTNWFSAESVFEWVPDPPATELTDASALEGGACPAPGSSGNAQGGSLAAPSGRLVLKGIAWRPYQTAFMQENPAWSLVHARKSDDSDDEPSRTSRSAARPVPPQEPDPGECCADPPPSQP